MAWQRSFGSTAVLGLVVVLDVMKRIFSPLENPEKKILALARLVVTGLGRVTSYGYVYVRSLGWNQVEGGCPPPCGSVGLLEKVLK